MCYNCYINLKQKESCCFSYNYCSLSCWTAINNWQIFLKKVKWHYFYLRAKEISPKMHSNFCTVRKSTKILWCHVLVLITRLSLKRKQLWAVILVLPLDILWRWKKGPDPECRGNGGIMQRTVRHRLKTPLEWVVLCKSRWASNWLRCVRTDWFYQQHSLF